MSLDISKVKSRLQSLSNTNTKSTLLWKPSNGKSVVRIVPYKYSVDNPFIELYFHYGVNGKTYLSPASFGRPDPIVEFANKLKKTGDKEEWKLGKKLEPKLRTYVPVLVRGQEDQGVKFWGFGKQVYQELLGIIADVDYGDISDPKSGRDILVEFIPTEESGASFPKTNIRVKPNQTPFTTETNTMEKVKNQTNIIDLFPELSYEELAKIMDEWMNPEKEPATAEEQSADAEETSETSEKEVVAKTEVAKSEAPAKTVAKSPTAESSVKTSKAKTSTDVADEFDALFNK